MKEFPDFINVKNKDNFVNLYNERIKCYLRRDIYEHLISKEEKEYFTFENYSEKIKDKKILTNMLNDICTELEIKGWKTKFAYGNTALFIYSKDLPDNYVDCEALQ
jgi:hypothetical protein